MTELLFQDLSDNVIGALIEVHRELGPGLLESAYEECLCFEFSRRHLSFQRQVAIPVRYKGIKLDCGYLADLIVEEKILLELKSVETLSPLHEAQLITYLKLTGIRVGLLVNFNCKLLKDGLIRRVL